MKIFAIRDDNIGKNVDLAYLFYYEKDKNFYIELPDKADEWETPFMLSSFVKRRMNTLNAYWSRLWVSQRIVPPDRQNLGQILKENGLKEYDEYELLMLANGRCAQDECFLVPITEEQLPKEFVKRYERKVKAVVPLKERQLLVFFRNGETKKCDIEQMLLSHPKFYPILKEESLFRKVDIQTGGYGVCWGSDICISDEYLYEKGDLIPLELDDFRSFVSNGTINTTEATELLGCSRQNIDDLVKRKKLRPIKTDAKNKLFLKAEVSERRW